MKETRRVRGSRLPRTFRACASRAPALEGRLRSARERSGQALEARPRGRRPLARLPGPRALRRAAAARREGTSARAVRRVGPRPPLVARPDGAHVAPARRADDARLARLVRDVEPGRRLAAADDRPEQPLPRARPRLVPRAAEPRHRGSGDARLAQRQRQLEVLAERELRPRDDGALHARRRPRLHRGRRAPERARADRLPQRLEAQRRPDELPLRPEVPRHRNEDDLQEPRRVHVEGLVPPLRHASGSSVVLRAEALELLRADGARQRDGGRASSSCT